MNKNNKRINFKNQVKEARNNCELVSLVTQVILALSFSMFHKQKISLYTG